LRPYPQYRDINTAAGAGDKSGHSSYHAWIVKLDKRYSNGVTLQGSYVFSKLLTDADGYNPDNGTLDHYNRRLEKSIGEFDLTHNLKMTYIWELPFGRGQRWATGGPLSWVLGGWRLAGSHFYASGYPLSIGNSAALGGILFSGRSPAHIPSYEGWIAQGDNPNWKGSDRFFVPTSFFGAQPNDRAGNATRHNPKPASRSTSTRTSRWLRRSPSRNRSAWICAGRCSTRSTAFVRRPAAPMCRTRTSGACKVS